MKKLMLIALAVSTLFIAGCAEMGGKESQTSEMEVTSTATDVEETTTEAATAQETTATAEDSSTPAAGQHAKIFDQAALDKVLALFKEKFGLEEFSKIQFDRDNGRHYFKVESLKDGQSYELKVDADSDEIAKEESESSNDQDQLFTMANILKPEEAFLEATKSIDAKYVPIEWQLDYDNNVLVYEFKVDAAGQELELKVDATTGAVIKIDD